MVGKKKTKTEKKSKSHRTPEQKKAVYLALKQKKKMGMIHEIKESTKKKAAKYGVKL